MFNAKKRTCFLTALPGLTLIAIMIITIGCQWEKPELETTVTTFSPTVTSGFPGEEPELEIELAVIYDCLVSFDESSPPQGFVYLRGALPDSCTTLHEIKIEYLDLPPEIHSGGSFVRITVTTQRPKDAECTPVYSFFEEHLTLSIDFIRGETYLLEVNGVATLFQ